jgi:hypothetical protein
MEIRYTDLLPEGHKRAEEFDKADWTKVNIGDTVEMTNIFSYRVVYFRKIFAKAQERANELKCDIKAFQKHVHKCSDMDLLCIQFYRPEVIAGPVPAYSKGKMNYGSHTPRHRGSYYGDGENVSPAFYGWNLVSIPFYPDGEPQPSEE